MNELALFAGAGGGILGGLLCGWRTVAAVEIEDYPRRVLLQRQADGFLPRFPIWDDVRTFDGKPWRGKVDVISGGFPCCDISSARSNNDKNGKQAGLDGEKSGLWSEMARIIGQVQPSFVFIENSPNLRSNGLCEVLKRLNSMGYNARWGVFGCRSFGADHHRNRMFIAAKSNLPQRERRGVSRGIYQEHTNPCRSNWWKSEPAMERVAYGMAAQMDRLKAIGNGQVPAVARLAWQTLTSDIKS